MGFAVCRPRCYSRAQDVFQPQFSGLGFTSQRFVFGFTGCAEFPRALHVPYTQYTEYHTFNLAFSRGAMFVRLSWGVRRRKETSPESGGMVFGIPSSVAAVQGSEPQLLRAPGSGRFFFQSLRPSRHKARSLRLAVLCFYCIADVLRSWARVLRVAVLSLWFRCRTCFQHFSASSALSK